VDTLAALLAGLLNNLRSIGPDVCPGPWAWATTVLGIAVAAFAAVGQVFSAAAAGGGVPGLTTAQVRNLGPQVCVAGAQSKYLGAGSVGDAFDPSDPVALGLAVLLLVVVPIVATLFVLAQIRLALRRGPAWPSRFFWLPFLALGLVTVGTPAGSSEHLWIGVSIGAFVGIVLTAMVGTPRPEVVARSLNPGPAADRRSTATRGAQPVPAQRHDPAPQSRPVQPPVRPPSTQTRVPPPRTLVAPAPTGGAPVPPPAFPAAAVQRPVRGSRSSPIRRIGAGGFGGVVLAHDAKLGMTVALKAAHAPDAETEERIRREAAALAAVRHPNCVRILDLVHARSDPGLAGLDGMVIVMEYVQGSSLGELVQQRGPLDDVAAARVWSGVAGALHAAHTRGVLHRDVKPGNVIVDPAGIAHLIDFGIARRTGDATLTMAGYVLGTPDYLAPEVAGGKKASPASDCWQLAATVSYALAGFPPRGGHPDAVSGLRAAAAGAKLTHLPRRSAHLSLLKSAMRNEPAKRPDLPTIQRGLDDWLRRHGGATTGAVTAGTGRR